MFRISLYLAALLLAMGCGGSKKKSAPPAAGDGTAAESSTSAPAQFPPDGWTGKGHFYSTPPRGGEGVLLCAVGSGPMAPVAPMRARGDLAKIFKTDIEIVIGGAGNAAYELIKTTTGATLSGVDIYADANEGGTFYALACMDLVAFRATVAEDPSALALEGATPEQAREILDLLIAYGRIQLGGG